MKITMGIRNPGPGGYDELTVEDTIATNDDITIKRRDGGSVSIWRGDIDKVIAALQAHLKVRRTWEHDYYCCDGRERTEGGGCCHGHE